MAGEDRGRLRGRLGVVGRELRVLLRHPHPAGTPRLYGHEPPGRDAGPAVPAGTGEGARGSGPARRRTKVRRAEVRAPVAGRVGAESATTQHETAVEHHDPPTYGELVQRVVAPDATPGGRPVMAFRAGVPSSALAFNRR